MNLANKFGQLRVQTIGEHFPKQCKATFSGRRGVTCFTVKGNGSLMENRLVYFIGWGVKDIIWPKQNLCGATVTKSSRVPHVQYYNLLIGGPDINCKRQAFPFMAAHLKGSVSPYVCPLILRFSPIWTAYSYTVLKGTVSQEFFF